MVIRSEQLLMRPILESDWQAVQEIWKDFAQSEYVQYDNPKDTEDEAVRSRIARWEAAGKGMDHLFFAVCLKEKVVGYIALNAREIGYEIGYCFHSDYHGKGYAKESLQAIISHLGSLGIHHFSAGTGLLNIPSVRLLESVGFKLTGTEKVSFYRDEYGKDIFFDGGIFELTVN